VRLLGGLHTKEPGYAAHYRRLLAEKLPGANVELCTRSGAFGAAALARADSVSAKDADDVSTGIETTKELAGAATEQVHPCAEKLEKMTPGELVALFVEEEDRVRAALSACKDRLANAVEWIADALSKNGRLFYAGAGTSGRLGVLDASEMPPTFGTPPDLVQGVIAGGMAALTHSVETAEDSREAGALAMIGRGVRAGDVVCGIAASGRTPFVLGALALARELGARTIFLTCNPARNPSPQPWDVEIDLPTGAEIVTGSTRLKAGTATKVALNILSTCAMIRLGKVRGGAMVNLRATNVKLRDRATRMVAVALGLDAEVARELLVANHWDVVAALARRPPGK
jgi:N-acetylmuramic acid 6-phosphate etherase